MLTVGALVDSADVPEARKQDVKAVLETLGYQAGEEVGEAFEALSETQLANARTPNGTQLTVREINAVLAKLKKTVPITSPSETNDLRRLGALVPFLQAMVIQGNYQGTSSTASTNKSQRQQQDFKLNLYNYYFRTNVQSLPDRFRCMISGLKLEHPQIIAAHLWPKSKAVEAAAVFNIPDVWNVRNGLLWANPFEKAWHQYEIAILRNPVDGELFLRVLTDDLMKTKLMDYQMGEGGCSFGFKCFRDFDGKEIQQVCEAAMPYKRALLHQAVSAIMYQRGRGELRKEVTLRVDDYEVASDFEKRPDVQRWVDSLLV